MHFIVIYTIDAHPSGSISPYSSKEWTAAYSRDQADNPVTQPTTYEERLRLARQTVTEAGIKVPVLVDEMDDPVWCTYGPAPNISYLIGTDGRIIVRQPWYDPQNMETALVSYLNSGSS